MTILHSQKVKIVAAAFVMSAAYSGYSKPEPDILQNTSFSIPLPAISGTPIMPINPAPVKKSFVDDALKSPRIVLIGDSIVHYSNELVSRRLEEVINAQNDQTNSSVIGVTKGGQLIRGWIGSQFDKYVKDPNNNIIVLQGGVNDIGWYGKTGYTQIRIEAFRKLLERFDEMVKEAQENKKVLVLVTVSPWKGQSIWNPVGQDYTEQLNSWMKKQSSTPGIFVADTYTALVTQLPNCKIEDDMLFRGYQGVDTQHTNDAGRKVIGEVIAESLGFTVHSLTLPEKTRGHIAPCPK